MDIKKIELYRNDGGTYCTSESLSDDVSGGYYQSADVDDHIKKLKLQHECDEGNLESELSDMTDERDSLSFQLATEHDFKEERDTLRDLLTPALKVLESISSTCDQEVTYNCKTTDVDGLISDIKWQMKGPVESSDSGIF